MLGAVELVCSVLRDPSTLSNFPELSSSVIEHVERLMHRTKSASYLSITDIHAVSPGLVKYANTVGLSQNWGVKISNTLHSNFLDRPESLRLVGDSFLIANNPAVGSLGCAVVDYNLNLKALVGTKSATPILNLGQYKGASDFNLNGANSRYYISSPLDNIVHMYDSHTTRFVSSIGTGVAGVPSELEIVLTQPVAASFSPTKTYVLCAAGTPSGATGPGFLSVLTPGNEFVSNPVFHGKNAGTGRCFQGEISSPRDMFVYTEGDKDLVYILNGFDEVGVFNSQKGYALETVYSIPNNFIGSNLGLSKITRDHENLYITAKNIGKVISINLATKQLSGSFGTLADESSTSSDMTLGKFNGLSGISVVNGQVHVAESINNRIQVFGTSLLKEDSLYITFMAASIPDNALLKSIAYDLSGSPITNIKLVDMSSGGKDELTLQNAKDKKMKYFQIKIILDPTEFSKNKSSYKVYPMYVLLE